MEIKLSKDRTFGFVFACFFGLIGFLPLLRHSHVRWWALALSGALLLAALIYPRCLHPLNLLAAWIAAILHRVISPLMAGLFFFLVVTPAALLLRCFRRDPLRLQFDRSKSYWVPREPPGPPPQSMVNQF